MLYGFNAAEGGRLTPLADVVADCRSAIWVDLLRPTPEEEANLEAALGLDIPTREEMEEIEVSSRLYTDDNDAFMTALLLSHADGDDSRLSPVTFILSASKLITVRYDEPRAFTSFVARAQKTSPGTGPDAVLAGLIEAVIERLADVLERTGHDIDIISRNIFRARNGKPTHSADYQTLILDLGRKGDLISKMRESLVTLDRLLGFFGLIATQRKSEKDLRSKLKTLSRDVRSLTDHVTYISQKITFLLDAILGMVNIEQTAIIKIFSVAAVVFLPPTLIASIYGMNFEFMPELAWPYGYPMALTMMVMSAILPYVFFKSRGWL